MRSFYESLLFFFQEFSIFFVRQAVWKFEQVIGLEWKKERKERKERKKQNRKRKGE